MVSLIPSFITYPPALLYIGSRSRICIYRSISNLFVSIWNLYSNQQSEPKNKEIKNHICIEQTINWLCTGFWADFTETFSRQSMAYDAQLTLDQVMKFRERSNIIC
jgi:hypothetical protein